MEFAKNGGEYVALRETTKTEGAAADGNGAPQRGAGRPGAPSVLAAARRFSRRRPRLDTRRYSRRNPRHVARPARRGENWRPEGGKLGPLAGGLPAVGPTPGSAIVPKSCVLDGGSGAKMATRGGYVRGPGGPNRHGRGPIWGPPVVRKSDILSERSSISI